MQQVSLYAGRILLSRGRESCEKFACINSPGREKEEDREKECSSGNPENPRARGDAREGGENIERKRFTKRGILCNYTFAWSGNPYEAGGTRRSSGTRSFAKAGSRAG